MSTAIRNTKSYAWKEEWRRKLNHETTSRRQFVNITGSQWSTGLCTSCDWWCIQPTTIDVLDKSPSCSQWRLLFISCSRLRSASSNRYKVPWTRLMFGLFRLLDLQLWTAYQTKYQIYLAQNDLKQNLRPICAFWHIAIFMINYVMRLWSQGGDVTHFIFGCERHIRKCATIVII